MARAIVRYLKLGKWQSSNCAIGITGPAVLIQKRYTKYTEFQVAIYMCLGKITGNYILHGNASVTKTRCIN
jgi:hypothetical protein